MFNNVGKKVQLLAKIMCWVGIVMSVIGGIALIVAGNQASVYVDNYFGRQTMSGGVLPGILVMILGSLGSWLGSLATYAIGEAAEYAEKH